jgi:hypothetical protein
MMELIFTAWRRPYPGDNISSYINIYKFLDHDIMIYSVKGFAIMHETRPKIVAWVIQIFN